MRPIASLVLCAALLVPLPAAAGWEEGQAAHRRGDYVTAARELQPLAAKGKVAATLLLAAIYRDGGGGMARDPVRAMQYYRSAAEAGDATAQHALAQGYAEGSGVSRSLFQAYTWLTVAIANAKDADRQAWMREREEIAASQTEGELAQARERAAQILGRDPEPAAARQAPVSPPAPARPAAKPVPLLPQPDKSETPTLKLPTRSAASGIVVTEDGRILTNAHVVPRCRTLNVTFPDGRRQPAAVVASNAADDLALLHSAVEAAEPARFRDGKPIRSGDGVVAVGFPLSSMLSREPNVTVGVVSALAGRRGDKRFLQITAPVQKGNSGGPLLDMSGNVVGIVATKLDAMKIAERTGDLPQNVNFAIRAEVAAKFLAGHGITPLPGPVGPDLSAADVGERAKRVTVFVECGG